MHAHGFEYTPNVVDDTMMFRPGVDDLAYYSPEWIDKYGFGVSTTRFPLYDRALADPRAVAYYDRVGDCVSDAGYYWDPTVGPWEYFEPKLAAINPFQSSLGTTGTTSDTGGTSSQRGDASTGRAEAVPDFGRLSDKDLDKLAAIQAEELELAKVVVGCDGGELNQAWFLGDIIAEYEQDFLDTNAAELEQFKAN